MKVELEKTFPMPVSVDTAWTFLQNIEGVARCVPGARITERVDATHYRGTIAVRMGPASLSFKGEIEVLELDSSRRTLRLIGKGADSSGTSAASMDLTARIEPGTDTASSALIGKSEVSMSGKAAAFGGRMMSTVADQILKQFAANLAVEAAQLAAASAAPADGATQAKATLQANGANTSPAASVPTTGNSQPASAVRSADLSASGVQGAPGKSASIAFGQEKRGLTEEVAAAGGVPSAKQHDVMAAQPLHPNASSDSADVPPTQLSVASTTPAAKANELNVVSLLWAIVRDWIRGVFRRGPA